MRNGPGHLKKSTLKNRKWQMDKDKWTKTNWQDKCTKISEPRQMGKDMWTNTNVERQVNQYNWTKTSKPIQLD